jgi:dTDP-4-amino-4,6-dideoxygalactose transaminase
MSDFIPFALPDIGQAEIDEVVDSLRSGWISTGPKVARFERQFIEFLGGGLEAVAVSSATAGLHLALEALGLGPGDEVIVPAHTFTATAAAVRYVGARPVLVDVEPAALTIDAEAAARAVTGRTRAIMPVHFAGLACDMAPLLDLARRRGLKVVEDAVHALPATYREAPIGTLDSAATVFSFYATKTVTAGEGGMVITRDKELAKRVRLMHLHGINRNVFDRYQGKGAGWYYEVHAAGYKYNMTDVAAAIAIHQLAAAEAMRRRRAEIAAAYDAAFAGLPLELPAQARPGDLHAWHLYAVRLTDAAPVSRDRFIEAMRERGIGCSVHYVPLHHHPYWRETCGVGPEDFPVSTAAFARMASLPIYTRMDDATVQRVINAVRAILG